MRENRHERDDFPFPENRIYQNNTFNRSSSRETVTATGTAAESATGTDARTSTGTEARTSTGTTAETAIRAGNATATKTGTLQLKLQKKKKKKSLPEKQVYRNFSFT